MKKMLLSMAAVAALGAVAAPAAAQSWNGYDRYDDYGRYDRAGGGHDIARRIDRSLHNGRISPREAARLHADLRQVQRLEWRFARDGRMTGWERAEISRRYDAVRIQLRHERNDRDYGYGYGYGWR